MAPVVIPRWKVQTKSAHNTLDVPEAANSPVSDSKPRSCNASSGWRGKKYAGEMKRNETTRPDTAALDKILNGVGQQDKCESIKQEVVIWQIASPLRGVYPNRPQGSKGSITSCVERRWLQHWDASSFADCARTQPGPETREPSQADMIEPLHRSQQARLSLCGPRVGSASELPGCGG